MITDNSIWNNYTRFHHFQRCMEEDISLLSIKIASGSLGSIESIIWHWVETNPRFENGWPGAVIAWFDPSTLQKQKRMKIQILKSRRLWKSQQVNYWTITWYKIYFLLAKVVRAEADPSEKIYAGIFCQQLFSWHQSSFEPLNWVAAPTCSLNPSNQASRSETVSQAYMHADIRTRNIKCRI